MTKSKRNTKSVSEFSLLNSTLSIQMYSKIAFTDQVQMSTFQFFGENGGEGETFSTPLSRVQVVRRIELP